MRGLVLGKFYPLHNGHSMLIESARDYCDRAGGEVVVLVMASDIESIPIDLRHDWVRDEHPGVIVRTITDNVRTDFDNDAIWREHIALIKEAVPEPLTHVFTSEHYGDELARRLGAKHVLVDIDRSRVPISGTEARADIPASWEHLPAATRRSLALRVVVLGAESSGTTTLAESLAEHYDVPYVREFGREYAGALIAEGRRWSERDFQVIAETQIQLEDAAAQRANGHLIICDTDAVATTVFEVFYLGAPDRATIEIASANRPDLYLLTLDDIPFEQDGTREGFDRGRMSAAMRAAATDTGVPLVEVSGDHERRMASATSAIDRLVSESWRFADPI